MYLPLQFTAKNPAHASDVIRQHPLASLISVDDAGLPFVTHLPLHLDRVAADGAPTALLGHVAKPNPHWRYLQARPQAVVTFLGPHAYMSPKVYPDLARVPTWNYLAVHCTVAARFIDPEAEKDALLKALIGDHEPEYAAQWRALPHEFQSKMMMGIVAFELTVTDWQCKIKLNQHRPEAQTAMRAAYEAGTQNEQALAKWMAQLTNAQ
jgi:transcriptional regulator